MRRFQLFAALLLLGGSISKSMRIKGPSAISSLVHIGQYASAVSLICALIAIGARASCFGISSCTQTCEKQTVFSRGFL
jgi:hypothetical protein